MCPLEKTGETGNISKETFKKIKYKQMMWKTYRHTGSEEDYAIYNNNNDLFCTNILKDHAQWHDKNQGIKQTHDRKQCVSRQRMDKEAKRLRRIGSIKEIDF